MMVNPVLAKELRDRVRTWRSPVLITAYLGILAGIGAFFLYEETRFGFSGPAVLRLGVMLFTILGFLQLGLISFLTPGMTAGIITGERERQTLPLLLVTRLSPFGIATGKALSAISYICLLIVVSLPIYSIVFLFGGVSLKDLLIVVLVDLVTTLMLAGIGLLCSALFRRTATAVVMSYLVTFFLYVGTLVIAAIIQILQQRQGWVGPPPPTPFIINFSPLVALGSVLPMGSSFVPFLRSNVQVVQMVNGVQVVNGVAGTVPAPTLLPWQINLLLDGAIILVTFALTIWLIQPLRKGRRKAE